ncbi:MAG: DNA-3-methyladenine glycosylase I [Chlamydiales bacterium]|nr:DNA-3-methyladenine glycosylase I [Chlamydiales bacterium]
MTKEKYCLWAEENELMQAYHDKEWGRPVKRDRKHFEFLILEGAQAGLSWNTILKKRENYREAFDDFDPEKIAKYTDKKLAKLLENPGIVRNRLKVQSTVKNAKAFLAIQKEFGSFNRYVWEFVGGKPIVNQWKKQADCPSSSKESDALSKDLKKRGMTFVGTTIIYAYMQAAGLINDHVSACPFKNV